MEIGSRQTIILCEENYSGTNKKGKIYYFLMGIGAEAGGGWH